MTTDTLVPVLRDASSKDRIALSEHRPLYHVESSVSDLKWELAIPPQHPRSWLMTVEFQYVQRSIAAVTEGWLPAINLIRYFLGRTEDSRCRFQPLVTPSDCPGEEARVRSYGCVTTNKYQNGARCACTSVRLTGVRSDGPRVPLPCQRLPNLRRSASGRVGAAQAQGLGDSVRASSPS
jgi:hypothetical protein